MKQTLDQRVTEIINSGNLSFVIQCGGRGRRLGCNEPKSLVMLPDGDRIISALLKDIPGTTPVYLHLFKDHEEVFRRYLSTNWNFGKRVTYLIQQEDILYDKKGKDKKPMTYYDGTFVTASNGTVTFVRQFGNPPDYFCLTDGTKAGISLEDVGNALEMLSDDDSIDVVVFTRELSDDEIRKDVENSRKSHARYARLNEEEQKVYEYPCIPQHIISDKDWLALAGMYVVRSERLIQATKGMKGRLLKSESMNVLFTGYAHHLKMTMTLMGYNGRKSGLSFRTYNPHWYIKGIKTQEDLENFLLWKQQGMFDYREE